jgi:hypothetical protein
MCFEFWKRALYEKPVEIRVARWFILRPKIQIWVYLGGPWNGKCWYVLRQFGVISDQYMAVWCSLWYTFPVLVCLDQEKSGNPGRNKVS